MTAAPLSSQYDCDFQGISQGWSDSYGSGLDCQWVDITGVPEGDYLLEIRINEKSSTRRAISPTTA